MFYPDDMPHKMAVIDKEIVIELETGMLLLHKHGNECMLVWQFRPVSLQLLTICSMREEKLLRARSGSSGPTFV